jgi:mannosyltransferase OCH1-like enzyme
MTIPKIIHQTYKDKKSAYEFKKWSDSWKLLNPEFMYVFYNDIDCFKFIHSDFPEYIDLYESLTIVQKADVFRYLILYKHGGVYADIDTECLKPINPLIELYNDSLITGHEYENHLQYLQWFIACPKAHKIMLNLVNEIYRRSWYMNSWYMKLILSGNTLTYYYTGPMLFTYVVSRSNESVTVLKKGVLGSYDKNKIDENSYLQHYFNGKWKK